MAQLILRNIDEELVRLLKIRAARRGSSAEAEHREILREALQPNSKGKSLKALLLEMPDAGEDEDKVKEQIYQSAAAGISGVPLFVINEEYGISGAQPPGSFTSVFDRVSNAAERLDSS